MSDPTEPSTTPSKEKAESPPLEHGTLDDENAPRSRPGLLGGRLVLAIGAVALGLVAAVVIISLGGDSDDSATDPSAARDIAAGNDATTGTDADPDAPGTSPPSTWQTTSPAGLEISGDTPQGALAAISVHDPATPTVAGQASQHCVLVTLTGAVTVETFGCAAIPDGPSDATTTDPVELDMSRPGDPRIGCAATETNERADAAEPIDATSQFVIPEDPELPAGDYAMTVVTVTGVGDGCPPTDGVTEHESSAETTIAIR